MFKGYPLHQIPTKIFQKQANYFLYSANVWIKFAKQGKRVFGVCEVEALTFGSDFFLNTGQLKK